ncbi:MAG: DUF2892 domain-containing protein [Chromatiaceae bacterium]|jgi:hypothetical protein|nr:DUF2892 domain-containing protein [Chromatiaceae bacterium]
MKQNVGNIDKVIRIVAGLALIGWGLYAQNWWGAIGAIPLATALMGWCPAYLPFGIRTTKDRKTA